MWGNLDRLQQELVDTQKSRDDEASLQLMRIEDLETSLANLEEQNRQDDADWEAERL